MKSERRHELKENTLARKLIDIPALGKKYGSRVALGIILICLVIVWIRYRMNRSEELLSAAQRSLADATLDIQRLKNLGYARRGDEMNVAQQRQVWYADALSRADEAIKDAGDQYPQIKAQALLDKGDANFNLANLPDLYGAATQPSLQVQPDRTELLSEGEDAYKQILVDVGQEHFQAMAAHFGLAAIAENRALAEGKDSANWDEARLQYQAVMDDDTASQPFKQYAQYRQDLLPQLKQTPLIGLVPGTQPSSMPSVLGPALPMIQSATTQSSVK
jgi:hypothetical protein